jgi:hypothetical protein
LTPTIAIKHPPIRKMETNNHPQRLTDDKTSASFKEKWGTDAMSQYWESVEDTRYFPIYAESFLHDIKTEYEALAQGVVLNKLGENDFFINPKKAWKYQI